MPVKMNPSRFHRRTPKITPENPRIFTAAPKIKRKSSCRDTKFIAPWNDDDGWKSGGKLHIKQSANCASSGGGKKWEQIEGWAQALVVCNLEPDFDTDAGTTSTMDTDGGATRAGDVNISTRICLRPSDNAATCLRAVETNRICVGQNLKRIFDENFQNMFLKCQTTVQ